MRVSAGRMPCASAQACASRRSRSTFSGVTASCGVPHTSEVRVFTSQTTSTVAVAEHEVDLAEVAAPVAVEHDQPLLDQVAGGVRLAVRPEGEPRAGLGCGGCGHAPSVGAASPARIERASRLWTAGARRVAVDGKRADEADLTWLYLVSLRFCGRALPAFLASSTLRQDWLPTEPTPPMTIAPPLVWKQEFPLNDVVDLSA